MSQPRDHRGRFDSEDTKVFRFGDPQESRAQLNKLRREYDRYRLRGRFLKYDPQQPRDKSGKWSSSGGGAASIATSRIDTHGGFTVHSRSGDEPTEGYAVSKWPERSLVFKRSGMHPSRVSRNIRNWLRENQDLVQGQNAEGLHIGGWYDESSGQVYVDFSVVHQRGARDAAIKDAIKHNQKAIYSLHDQEEINTGGTGEAMDKAQAPNHPDKFFIPVAGKTVNELADQVMEALGLSVDEDDDED